MPVLIALVLVAAACDSGGGESDVLPDDETTTTEEDSSPADSRIDDLYRECEEGDDDACDDLYAESEAGSPEEAFGNNCGGRGLPPGEVWCGPERQAQHRDEPAPTEPIPDAGDLEAQARDAFVESCTASGGESTPERCNCSFDYIVDEYGLEFFETVSPDLESVVAEAVASCV